MLVVVVFLSSSSSFFLRRRRLRGGSRPSRSAPSRPPEILLPFPVTRTRRGCPSWALRDAYAVTKMARDLAQSKRKRSSEGASTSSAAVELKRTEKFRRVRKTERCGHCATCTNPKAKKACLTIRAKWEREVSLTPPPMPLDSLEGDKSDLKNVLPTRSPSVSIRLTPFSLSQPFAD